MKSFENKNALITGASRGIGRAIAISLAKEGANVAVNYNKSEKEADEVCNIIIKNGGKAIPIKADVSKEKDVNKLISQIENKFGGIDILVNNAGIAKIQAIEDIKVEDFDQVIKTNLRSSFLVTQAVLPYMRRNSWGRVLMISSVAAQTGGKVGLHYAASKAGQLGLMHHYAGMLASEGITVNAIAPAIIKTDMASQLKNVKPEMIPVQRFGTSEEVADLALTILKNGYITNQTFNIDGGLYPS